MKRARRPLLTITDQGVAALSNLVLAVVVARAVSRDAFGEFSLMFGIYLVLQGVERGLVTDALLVRFSNAGGDEQQRAIAGATGYALVNGAVAGVLMMLVGAVWQGRIGTELIVLGLGLPALALQDCMRYSFFARGEPERALTNDLLWLTGICGGLAVVSALAGTGVVAALAVWEGAALVAGAVGCLRLGIRPSAAEARPFAARNRGYGIRYAAEFLTGYGSIQVVMISMAGIIGLAAAGAVRGAYTILGPLNTFMNGALAAAFSETARARRHSVRRVLLVSLAFTIVVGAGCLIGGLTVDALPDKIGVKLLGDTWATASTILIPITLTIAANGVAVGARAGIRAFAAPARGLVVRLMVSPVTATGAFVGGLVSGMHGLAWGLAIGNAVGASILWAQCLVLSRAPDPVDAHMVMSDEPEVAVSGPEDVGFGGQAPDVVTR